MVDPALEPDLGLDEFLKVVVVAAVCVERVVVPVVRAAPATVAALGLVGAPCLMDVRQRKRVIAVGRLRGRSEQDRALRIGALQTRSVQPAARVLVIEQVDQAIRALGWREVLGEAVRQGVDELRVEAAARRGGLRAQNEL